LNAVDVLLAATVLVFLFGVAAYALLSYSAFLAVEAYYARCFSEALRASDFLINSTSGVAVTDQPVVVPGRVDCTKLPSAYLYLQSRGFTGYVSCGPFSAGSAGSYTVTLHRRVYDVHLGPVVLTVSACAR